MESDFSVGVVNIVNSAPVDTLESAYLLPHQLLLPLLYWKLLAFRTVSKTHCSSRSDIGGGTECSSSCCLRNLCV